MTLFKQQILPSEETASRSTEIPVFGIANDRIEDFESTRPMGLDAWLRTKAATARAQQQTSDDIRDACLSLAKKARDRFFEASTSSQPDEADAAFAATKDCLEQLWDFAPFRDRPFRDLLAALEAGLKRVDLAELSRDQRNVISQALFDLCKWFLDEDTSTAHIDRLTDCDVDLTGPIRTLPNEPIEVVIRRRTT